MSDWTSDFFTSEHENVTKKSKVMIVDKDFESRSSIVTMLRGYYLVYAAASIFQASKNFVKEKPDVILVDFEMLDDGNSDWFDSVHKKIPVIFLSRVNDKKRILKSLDMKPDWFILKPPTQEKLLSEIQKVLGKPAVYDQALADRTVVEIDPTISVDPFSNKILSTSRKFSQAKNSDVVNSDDNFPETVFPNMPYMDESQDDFMDDSDDLDIDQTLNDIENFLADLDS